LLSSKHLSNVKKRPSGRFFLAIKVCVA
jgi:hypothetical protein